MNIDSNTKVSRLLLAIPSSALVFEQFAINTSECGERSLEQACEDGGIGVEQFLQALENLDWGREFDDSSRTSAR